MREGVLAAVPGVRRGWLVGLPEPRTGRASPRYWMAAFEREDSEDRVRPER